MFNLPRASETRRRDAHQRSGKDHQQRDSDAAQNDDAIRDGAEGLPAPLVVAAFEVIEEHRHENDRQRAGREQIIQKIRKGKAGEVKVCLAGSTQRAADDLLAYETHNATDKD